MFERIFKMRRPVQLKRSGLKAADFRIIGEIVVLAGLIEDTLKRIPLEMLRVDYIPGVAMTAHLKSSSLCDIILTLEPYFLEWQNLADEVISAIALVRRAADSRNDIAHGPFWLPIDGEFVGARRFTARGKLKLVEKPFDTAKFQTALAEHVSAWEAISDVYVGVCALSQAREDRGLGPLRPDFSQRANRPRV